MRLDFATGLCLLLSGIVLGLAGGWQLWASSHDADASNPFRPGVVLAPGTVVAPRTAGDSKVSHALPKGVKVVDKGNVTITHPKCSEPIAIACTVVEEKDGGKRLVFDVPGGTVVDSTHVHVEDSQIPPKQKPWRVLLIGAYDPATGEWKPGAEAGRAVGPFEFSAGTIPGVVDAFVGVGLRY